MKNPFEEGVFRRNNSAPPLVKHAAIPLSQTAWVTHCDEFSFTQPGSTHSFRDRHSHGALALSTSGLQLRVCFFAPAPATPSQSFPIDPRKSEREKRGGAAKEATQLAWRFAHARARTVRAFSCAGSFGANPETINTEST